MALKNQLFTLVVLFLALLSNAARATEAEMNEIKIKDYKDFTTWPLITVRYRRDSSEQRFVYANEIALKALKKKNIDYPDGSVFIKTGYITEDDPLFFSSAVPSGALRIQVMVRDKNRYKEQKGWGYAIFYGDGSPMVRDPKNSIVACAACHNIAASRGYVFSELMTPPFTSTKTTKPLQKAKTTTATLLFSTAPLSQFAKNSAVYQYLSSFKTIRAVSGDVSEANFFGSFNEMWPSLLEEAVRSHQPAVLYNKTAMGFGAALKYAGLSGEPVIDCPDKQTAYEMIAILKVGTKISGRPLRKFSDSTVVCR